MIACNVCGGPADPATRCTNGRCAKCHPKHCTSGGATSPGHFPIIVKRLPIDSLFPHGKEISDTALVRALEK